ncbi:MAG TPA: hypothetical protein DCR71_04995 [Dehalococcoidia bacterium]|jgi:DNA-directed RNA polymerase subunit M/transcription elongation factor TFIIS|nr:hypothetical protein [Dehalococcoidia bacterium]
MVMWKAKKCPKCGGDMYIDVDENIWFDHCLQCGYMKNITEVLCSKCGELVSVNTDGSNQCYYCEKCGNSAGLCRSVR